ncbi:HAMP domain-containing protein [Corynebacterium hindlerae]|uniref:adenylate/guanylate cyclase domain-containing protein n=1 Tax=Corynebacterium hindlerae TaxID=699041 RepID=UPI001AD63659|nr:adenylate/guanylate cyclase domain-containing protein [Corynebacterium hindlerae]QTH60083.1 HAMP domain-containing protein [Corynebacterium hindlerae]
MTRFAQIVKWLWRTSWPLYAATIFLSNVLGAIATMLFFRWLIPMPEKEAFVSLDSQLPEVGIGYLVAGSFIGAILTFLLFRPVLAWQHSPEDHDPNMVRNLVMRIPVYQAILCAVIWFIGIVVVTSLAAQHDGKLALVLGLVSSLGGSVVVLLTYLEAERIVRPIAAQALAQRFEDSTLEPPVTQRLRVTWVITAAVPMLAICLLVMGHHYGYFTDTASDLFPAILALGVISLLAGFAAQTLVIMSVVDPIHELQNAINRVRRGETDVAVDIYDGSEIGVLQAGFNEMMRGLRERQRVRDLFGRYVGTEVARRAMEERPTLGGEDRNVAVLFVDVIGSTTFAVNHTPEEVVAALNEFFEKVVDVVHKHRGVINKFQGDAALAIFGAPLPLADAPGLALAAARELRSELKDMELTCGIGVASGHVVAGHIGGHDRFEYTVIGDAVNQAARLTELAKDAPGRVLTSVSTLRGANEAEQARWTVLKSVELRGRGELTQLARPIRPTLADRS